MIFLVQEGPALTLGLQSIQNISLQKFNYTLNNFGVFENFVMTQSVGYQQLPVLQLLTYGYRTTYRNKSIFTIMNDQYGYFDPFCLVLRGEVIQSQVVSFLKQSFQATCDFRL